MSAESLILSQSTRAVLLSSRIADNSTVVDEVGTNTGFPASNLLDPQPRRKWSAGSPLPGFTLDLQQNGTVPRYNTFGLLFHSGDPQVSTWRIRTSSTQGGPPLYDSGTIPLWPSGDIPSPASVRSSKFYREGAHSFHHLDLFAAAMESINFPNLWLTLPGAINTPIEYLRSDVDVNWGVIPDRDSFVSIRFRNSGAPADQMLLSKNIINFSGGEGYFLGLQVDGTVIAGVGDGVTDVTVARGDYTDNDWHVATMAIDSANDLLQLYLDGVLIDSADISTVTSNSDTNSDLIVGSGSSGILSFIGDFERVIVTRQELGGTIFSFNEWLNFVNSWMGSQNTEAQVLLDGTILASSAQTANLQSDTIGFRSTTGPDSSGTGELDPNIDFSTGETAPSFLVDRFVQVDIGVGPEASNFLAGRFFIAEAIQPLVPYPSSMPTPLGTPPKVQVSWDTRLTDLHAELLYGEADFLGNSPNVLRSWNHDVHLIDGGKTVCVVNNIDAAEPHQVHQQTVYGYLSSFEEVSRQRTQLVNARLSVRGM